MTKKSALIRSLLVALIVGLVFPAVWVAFTGDSYKTPIVEKRTMDQMSDSEREQWISNNSKKVGFFEHVTSLPGFISEHLVGYLQASFGIFIAVFLLNGAYLLGSVKNEP